MKHSLYKEENYINSYGWHCEICAPETYKDVEGNSECKPCHIPLVTDRLRKTCYDPFITDFTERLSPLGIGITVITILKVVSILYTIATFMRFRDTPMVRHANRNMTILHLLSHLLLSIVPIALFLGKPNRLTCLLKPIFIGVFFTISVSVNLAKTQKLTLIFSSKTVLSEGRKKLIDGVEVLIISSIVILDLLIFTVTFINRPTKVIFVHHNLEYIKEMTCNNNEDIIVQLTFVLIPVLANGIQAVRSRKLPSHFKETTHVIYSSFISTMVLGAVAAIYFLQKKETTKNLVLAFSILALNTIHFGLIYCYKVYVMIFKPELNTKAAFNQKRKSKFNKQFEQPTNLQSSTTIPVKK